MCDFKEAPQMQICGALWFCPIDCSLDAGETTQPLNQPLATLLLFIDLQVARSGGDRSTHFSAIRVTSLSPSQWLIHSPIPLKKVLIAPSSRLTCLFFRADHVHNYISIAQGIKIMAFMPLRTFYQEEHLCLRDRKFHADDVKFCPGTGQEL